MPLLRQALISCTTAACFFKVAPLYCYHRIRFGQSVQVKEKNAAVFRELFRRTQPGLVVLFKPVALSPLSSVPGEVMFSMFFSDGHRQLHYCTIRTNS